MRDQENVLRTKVKTEPDHPESQKVSRTESDNRETRIRRTTCPRRKRHQEKILLPA